MRWLGLLLGLGACEAPEPIVQDFGDIDGTPFLDFEGSAREAFGDRILPAMAPRVRLVPGGPDLDGDTWGAARQEWVVVDPTPWPRVVVEVADVRVLLYVERAALQKRVVSDLPGTGFGGQGQVAFRQSVPVEIVDEVDDRVQVEAQLHQLTAWAWLPRHAVDEVYVDGEDRGLPALPDGPSVTLLGRTEVLDAPAGEALAQLDGEPDVPRLMARQLGDADGGWIPVSVSSGGVQIGGWVFEDELVRNVGLGHGCSCCGGIGGWGSGFGRFFPSAVVPAGTWLHAGVDGEITGIAMDDIEVPHEALEWGADIRRSTPLGSVDLWAAPEDVVLQGVP